MNSAINKTFYTCSTESLFLKYKKISSKAVKLASFLHYSVHIFLRHDNCIRKINLRILWKHFLLKALIIAGFLTFDALESIHKLIIGLYVLQCLFVRRSKKKQRRGRIISSYTKGETYSSLMTTKYSWG